MWDIRLGYKPDDFESLPIEPKRFRKMSKKYYTERYINEIEKRASEKELSKYRYVKIERKYNETQFEKFWDDITNPVFEPKDTYNGKDVESIVLDFGDDEQMRITVNKKK